MARFKQERIQSLTRSEGCIRMHSIRVEGGGLSRVEERTHLTNCDRGLRDSMQYDGWVLEAGN